MHSLGWRKRSGAVFFFQGQEQQRIFVGSLPVCGEFARVPPVEPPLSWRELPAPHHPRACGKVAKTLPTVTQVSSYLMVKIGRVLCQPVAKLAKRQTTSRLLAPAPIWPGDPMDRLQVQLLARVAPIHPWWPQMLGVARR